MIGALFVRELSRSGRGRLVHYARWIYAGWLVLVLYFHHAAYYTDYLVQAPRGGFPAGATADFAHKLVDQLVWQQTLVVLLAAPSFAAGAVTDEKVRGTLEPLFLADLTPGTIILGKLAARVAQGFLWSLAAWPVIAFVGIPGGVAPIFFVALAVVTVLMLAGACAASLLVSVWFRTTRDAVVAVYAITFVTIGLVAYARNAGPAWEPIAALDPNYILDTARDRPDYAVLGRRLRLATMVWGAIAIVCTGLASWRLRPAFIKQQVRRRSRLLAMIVHRPPMGDRPIAWKEQHLSRWPRWLGLTIVSVLAIALTAYVVLDARSVSDGAAAIVYLHWSLIFLISLFAGVRASSTIVMERDRQTWESLLCTPYDFQRIVEDKMAGIIQSVWPYYFAALIPAAAVLSIANLDQLLSQIPPWSKTRDLGLDVILQKYGMQIANLLLGTLLALAILLALSLLIYQKVKVPWYPWSASVLAIVAASNAGWFLFFVPLGILLNSVAMRFMAGAGLWMSARSTNGWFSLLSTVLVGYVAAVIVVGASCPLAGVSCCLGGLVGQAMEKVLGDGFAGLGQIFAQVFFALGCLLGLWWIGNVFRSWAVSHLERVERVPSNYIRLIDLDQPYMPARLPDAD